MKYAMELFDVRPWHFLIKPLDSVKIEQIVRTYLSLQRDFSESFTYKRGHTMHKVPLKDIMFIESVRQKLILYLSNSTCESFYGSLKTAYETQLEQYDFLLLHASFVVNFDFIAKIKGNALTLLNGSTLPISHHRRKDISAQYLAIIERRYAR
jgi:DNA-binding LytR/AlgR family response regulator